jgi:prevent-host-death family protein
MKSMQLREAKAKFSALVEAAENGETTLITKNGRPAARVAPVEQAGSVQAEKRPNLIDHLMAMPAEIPIRRNRSRARSVKF